jgi:hypothetical protein
MSSNRSIPSLRPLTVAATATAAGLGAFAAPGVASAATTAEHSAVPHTASLRPDLRAQALAATALGDSIARFAVSEQAGGGRGNENPPGSNCNFYSNYFHRGCEQWCSDFAEFAWKGGNANIAGINASAASFAEYGVRNNTWHAEPKLAGVQPGDAVLYNLRSDGHFADHVGIVTTIDSGGVWVVSGNYHDGVYKHRAPDAGVISGFVSPLPA